MRVKQPVDERSRRRTRAVSLVCALLVMGGCRTAFDPAAIQDAQTAAQVKTALINDPALGARTIEVVVLRGVARLAGTVRTQQEIDRAVDVTRSVPGVSDVQVALEIGRADPTPEPQPRGLSQSGTELDIGSDGGSLFAVGLSVGWSGPTARSLDSSMSIGPLFRFGAGRGLAPTIAFEWFTTDVTGTSAEGVTSRMHVRPLMGGVGYTFGANRVSIAPSIVAGVAFNSLTVPVTGEGGGIAVEVANSFIWRPGVSVWIDLNRRAAVNLSMGYAFTGLNVTFLEGTQLVQHKVPGDTTIAHVGMVYKLF